MTDARIEAKGLKKHFMADDDLFSRLFSWGEPKRVKAVDGVNITIKKGEAVGVAGESGCGKTTLGKTLLKLLEPDGGTIEFDGHDITNSIELDDRDFRTEAQVIHQDPYKSLNPRFTVYDWVKEPLDIHNIGTAEEREAKVMESIEMAGLRPAEVYANEYPSELSGGERQRVGIARAIVMEPSFIVADEPVSMLDVSVRASVLGVLQDLQDELDLSIMYVSHDLSLLKHTCDRLVIMYLGRVVEEGPAHQVINNPKHPYTKALVSSTPIIDPDTNRTPIEIEGEVPDPINLPPGCRFAPRCPEAMADCENGEPRMYDVNENQSARCILYDDQLTDGTGSSLESGFETIETDSIAETD
jgi:peptide/nickel transport system ATP-binding protein